MAQISSGSTRLRSDRSSASTASSTAGSMNAQVLTMTTRRPRPPDNLVAGLRQQSEHYLRVRGSSGSQRNQRDGGAISAPAEDQAVVVVVVGHEGGRIAQMPSCLLFWHQMRSPWKLSVRLTRRARSQASGRTCPSGTRTFWATITDTCPAQQPRAAVKTAPRFDELVVVGHGLQVAPGGAVVGIETVLGATLVGREHASAAGAQHVPVGRRGHDEVETREPVGGARHVSNLAPGVGVGQRARITVDDRGPAGSDVGQVLQARARHGHIALADLDADGVAALLTGRHQRRPAAAERVKHPAAAPGEEAQNSATSSSG